MIKWDQITAKNDKIVAVIWFQTSRKMVSNLAQGYNMCYPVQKENKKGLSRNDLTPLNLLVHQEGFEPPTYEFVGSSGPFYIG